MVRAYGKNARKKTVKKAFRNISEGKKFHWKAKRAVAGRCQKLSEENVC
jgi:hypothetical protein